MFNIITIDTDSFKEPSKKVLFFMRQSDNDIKRNSFPYLVLSTYIGQLPYSPPDLNVDSNDIDEELMRKKKRNER